MQHSEYVAAPSNPYAPAVPTRPLDLLIAGGAVALGGMAGILAIVYKTWYLQEMSQDLALWISGFLFFVYAGGVYVFCYGWERGDAARAVRLTAVIVMLSAVAVLILAVALSLLSKAKDAAGASEAAPGTASENDFDVAGTLRVLGSYVDDGSYRSETSRPPESDLYAIDCHNCGQRYIPIPPRALCPSCNWAAVTVA